MALILTQKWLKQGCCTGLQKHFQGQTKVFLGSTGHQLKKQIYLIRFGHTKARLFSKKRATFWPKFPSWGIPIWTVTVLDEQGVPLRCSGHAYISREGEKIPYKMGGHGNLGIGAKEPI